MKNKLLDILRNNKVPVENSDLVKYITNQLSNEEQHELEKNFPEAGFEIDAMEGKSYMPNQQRIDQITAELNNKLLHQLNQKNLKHKHKKGLLQMPWTWITFGIIISILILAFLIINYLKHQ